MSKAMNVLALVRDEHRFIFLYDDNSIDTVLATLSEYASDPEMEFSWYDAAILAQRVRGLIEDQESEANPRRFPRAA